MKSRLIFTSMLCLLFGCTQTGNNKKELAAYEKTIDTWHKKRIDDLKADNGWLNLTGLNSQSCYRIRVLCVGM